MDICSRCGTFACRECLVVGADGQGVCTACQARQGETAPMAWERRSEIGFFKAYWETTKGIMFSPNTAFDKLEPETGSWWDPLSYAIFSTYMGIGPTYLIYALAIGSGMMFSMFQKSSGGNELSGGVGLGIMVGIIIGIIIFIPIVAIINAFILAGIEHLCLKLVGAQPRSFEATLRAHCYSDAPMFWGVVPFCGPYAFFVWQLVCRIFGYKAVHKTTGGKAAAGVLLPLGAICLCVGGAYAILIAVAMSAGH